MQFDQYGVKSGTINTSQNWRQGIQIQKSRRGPFYESARGREKVRPGS